MAQEQNGCYLPPDFIRLDLVENNNIKQNINRKFWEELIAYFPVIRHGPHRKRRVQLFFYSACVFVAAVTFSPSRCLVTIGKYTYRHTDWWGGLWSTIFWDITPCSPLRINRRFRGTYRLHLQGRKSKQSKNPAWEQVASSRKMVLFKTTAVRTSNPMKFHKDLFKHSKVDRGDTQTQRQQSNLIRLPSFFSK
jgi:hypothetical protein